MSNPAGSDARELVRQAVDIVDLVQGYLPLRRSGRNFVGLCPWHNDSKPSLQVNPQRQIFKCWVCNIGGDIFNFVMQMEGVEFREALQILADRAGVSCQPVRGNATASSDKQLLYRAAAWAEQTFQHYLQEAQEAQEARNYLATRGIDAASVDRFHLGYAPNRWDWMLSRPRPTEFTPPVLEKIGLLRRRETADGYYDWFRGRVMFSIRDVRGRPVGFGGRILPQLADDRAAKYINSPETVLFSKSQQLYGLDLARDGVGQRGEILVMEGYTDVVMAHQAGIENAVAVLGTALSEKHIPLLLRYTDRVVLVLDGDEAGRRRASEILEIFVSQPIDLRILTLPGGVDPCDFISSHGSEAFRALLTTAVDALQHKLNMVTQGLDVERDTHRASEAIEQVLSTLAKARPGKGVPHSSLLLREQMILSRLVHQFRLPEEELRNRLAALRRQEKRRSPPSPLSPLAPSAGSPAPLAPVQQWPAWEREVIELLLLWPERFPELSAAVPDSAFAHPVATRIYSRMRGLWEQGQQDLFAGLMDISDDPQGMRILIDLEESAQAKSQSDQQRWCDDLIRAWQTRQHHARHEQLRIEAGHHGAEADALFAQWIEQSRSRHLEEMERRKL